MRARTRPRVVDYARALRLTFSLLLDERGIVSASYGVVGLPTSFLFARDGRAIARDRGARVDERSRPRAHRRAARGPSAREVAMA
jgi:hypothetical protein